MSTDEPVTVVVTRSIKPGLEQAAESWAARAIEVASRWPGHLGGFVIRQAPGRFSLVFRFASLDRLMAWESSGERAALLEEVAPLTAGITAQRLSGLEPFFALPGAPIPLERISESREAVNAGTEGLMRGLALSFPL